MYIEGKLKMVFTFTEHTLSCAMHTSKSHRSSATPYWITSPISEHIDLQNTYSLIWQPSEHNIYGTHVKAFVSTYLLSIYTSGVLHYKIFKEIYIMWPTLLSQQFFLNTKEPYFKIWNNFFTYVWRFYTKLGHNHRPRHYQPNNVYI